MMRVSFYSRDVTFSGCAPSLPFKRSSWPSQFVAAVTTGSSLGILSRDSTLFGSELYINGLIQSSSRTSPTDNPSRYASGSTFFVPFHTDPAVDNVGTQHITRATTCTVVEGIPAKQLRSESLAGQSHRQACRRTSWHAVALASC